MDGLSKTTQAFACLCLFNHSLVASYFCDVKHQSHFM